MYFRCQKKNINVAHRRPPFTAFTNKNLAKLTYTPTHAFNRVCNVASYLARQSTVRTFYIAFAQIIAMRRSCQPFFWAHAHAVSFCVAWNFLSVKTFISTHVERTTAQLDANIVTHTYVTIYTVRVDDDYGTRAVVPLYKH